jgi:hypothetical protein
MTLELSIDAGRNPGLANARESHAALEMAMRTA